MMLKAPAGKFASTFKEFYDGYRVIDVAMDSLGEIPGTGGDGDMSFGEKLRSCGIPVRSTTFADKNDENFIQNIQQVLEIPDQEDSFGRKIPKLAIMAGNDGIVDDIETVCWLKQRNQEGFKPKLDISAKEKLSLLKYALATQIGFVATIGRTAKVKRSGRSPWSGGLY